MSDTNTNLQNQTSNYLHNAIMEAGGKDRPPMLEPGNYFLLQLQPEWQRSQQAATRNRGMVAEDDEMSKEKEIDKLIALISLSFNKIYKPTNNNLRTSSNTSRANQDNTPRIKRGTGYDNHRVVNVVRARENIADWRDDTDDEPKDQELEAHYMYMAQIQEVTLDAVDNFGRIFDAEPLQKVQNDDDNYNVFANDREHPEQPESINVTYLKEHGDTNITTDSLDMSNNGGEADQDEDEDLAIERYLLASIINKLKCEIDDNKNHNKLLKSSNKTLVDKLKSEIEDFKTKNKSLESSNSQFKEANNELSKTNQLMFKDLKKFQTELDRSSQVSSEPLSYSESVIVPWYSYLLSLSLDFFLLALSLAWIQFSSLFNLLRCDGYLPLERPLSPLPVEWVSPRIVNVNELYWCCLCRGLRVQLFNDEVFSTWMAFGGNTRDLGLFGEEKDEITDLHQILEEVLLVEREDSVSSIKRRCHDPSSDDVIDLVTASGLFRNLFLSTTTGDANPIHTLGDYSKPSHKGYMNTIKLPVGNNVLAIGLENVSKQDPSQQGRICNLLVPCSILSTGKDRKTPQRYLDVPTTSWRIFIRSMDSRLRKLRPDEDWATIKRLAQYEDEGWNDAFILVEMSLNYKNPDIEQLLGFMKSKVDTLMKDAISLMGRSKRIFRMTTNEMY
ncbi:hypothetical protein Tco_1127153 [Tanacetum coccineum]